MKEELLLKVLKELMINARQSDRVIAQKLRVSQPTVTRARIILEKGYINCYTAIPSFTKIGYELFALTFVKTFTSLSREERRRAGERGRKWILEQPNVIFACQCSGLGFTGLMISFHKNYSDYVEFMRKCKSEWSGAVTFQEPIIIHMRERQLIKPLSFASLIETEKQ
ncbi:MAG: hypothetical protein ACUVT5_01840 [Candidatus Bathyarchaeales archaeon]